MPSYTFTNSVVYDRDVPAEGGIESVFSVEFTNKQSQTTALQGLSAIKLLERFANIIALSAGTTNADAISAAVNSLDGLGYASNS